MFAVREHSKLSDLNQSRLIFKADYTRDFVAVFSPTSPDYDSLLLITTHRCGKKESSQERHVMSPIFPPQERMLCRPCFHDSTVCESGGFRCVCSWSKSGVRLGRAAAAVVVCQTGPRGVLSPDSWTSQCCKKTSRSTASSCASSKGRGCQVWGRKYTCARRTSSLRPVARHGMTL